MSVFEDKIAALQTDVANTGSVEASAATLVNGIAGLVNGALAAALAKSATEAQLGELSALAQSLEARAPQLGAAIVANTQPQGESDV